MVGRLGDSLNTGALLVKMGWMVTLNICITFLETRKKLAK